MTTHNSPFAEAATSPFAAVKNCGQVAAQILPSEFQTMFDLETVRFQSEENLLEQVCALVDPLQEAIKFANSSELRSTAEQALRDLVSAVRPKLTAEPEARIRTTDFIQTHCTQFPWALVQSAPNALAFLYNFSPFQDTGATVASKRIRNFAKTFDVVSCSFLHKKKMDATVERIGDPYIHEKYFLPMNASWASWEPFMAFAEKAAAFAEQLVATGNQYEMCYSRAMWAPSIYAGMLFKEAHPEVEWVVEFSDPLSLDVEGLPRGGKVPEDRFSAAWRSKISLDFPDCEDVDFTVFSLAEYLAYSFADQIIFTNSNQKITMLECIESPALRERIEKISVVSNHPTLPRDFYLAEPSNYEVDDTKLNLGYFGEFYSSRSIHEVTSAMRSLPPHLRERVNLHVFTNYIPASEGNQRPRNFSKAQFDALVKRAYEGVGAWGIEDNVRFNASLPYLKFLGTTEKLDYLIVNDASSGEHHSVNPYLPSKWSDYAGSSASTWAFVEEGSILSSKPATVHSPVGDAYAARQTLWQLIEEKFPELCDSEID